MGIHPVACSESALNDCDENVLVNCIGVAPQRLSVRARRLLKPKLLIVTDAEQVEKYRHYGAAMTLPTSYARIRAACLAFSRPIAAKHATVAAGPT